MTRLVITLIGAIFSLNAAAASVNVKWQNPEEYTDIQPAEELKSRYHKHVMTQLGGYFERLGKQLPEGYQWNITVTDVDLAGDVQMSYRLQSRDYRVVKPIFFPKMDFTWTILDADKNEVLAGTEKLKDMGFQTQIGHTINNSFPYEKEMLKRWFRKTVLPQLEG